jgi:geranylgeranyl pyrophosphate synthase
MLIAVALEILHGASLIHDDLPALDNDDERRGRASLHCVFDEATAVLVGDYLVPYALRLCSQINSLAPEQVLKIVGELSRGYEAVCVGQILDAREDTSREHLAEVHRLKTAALFKAAASCAAVSGQLSSEVFSSVVALGESFGMYFQLVDDFLDREDGAPNYFSALSLPEAMEALDSTWLGLENAIVSLEALSARRTLTRTREVCTLVRNQVLA